jgi:hypothetical protein
MGNYEIRGNLGDWMGATASTSEVKKFLDGNPDKREAFVKDPIGQLDKVVKEVTESKPAYYNDRFLYRWVAMALGFAVILALGFATLLAMTDKTVPDILVAVGSAAIGALAGLFAPKNV